MVGKILLILILVLCVALAVPSTRATLMEKAAPVMNGFKTKLVPSRLEAMADQLEIRVNRGEGFPSSWEGWLQRDFSGEPQDPWGHTYFLQTGRASFTVGSLGPDGVQNTDDDIKVTRRLGK